MHFLNPEKLPEISFSGKLLRTGGWGHGNVTKPKHLLVMANTGSFDIYVNGKKFVMEKDSVLFIPKNTPYALESHSSFEHVVIHFDADIREEKDSPRALPFSEYNVADTSVRVRLERAAKVELSDDEIVGYERRCTLLRTLLALCRLTERKSESRLVREINTYFSDHLYDRLSLDEIAAHFGYSKQYIIRVFKRETGKTPMAALNELKLTASAAELMNEEKSVAEVAAFCGFDDYNYFSRVFRRQFGISPSGYRKTSFDYKRRS